MMIFKILGKFCKGFGGGRPGPVVKAGHDAESWFQILDGHILTIIFLNMIVS